MYLCKFQYPPSFLTLLSDPCFGGVSASYAMQSDIRIGVSKARLGFSGPAVILNTQFAMDQNEYDLNCPAKFQTMEFAHEHG
jgi:acetyl-CoA carboxylase carboxyl transferase subunit beta